MPHITIIMTYIRARNTTVLTTFHISSSCCCLVSHSHTCIIRWALLNLVFLDFISYKQVSQLRNHIDIDTVCALFQHT